MTKDEAIQKMVEIAEEFNLQAIQGSGMEPEQIEQMMAQVRPQLYMIQGAIYDALVDEGVIK